jgi:hypothetical protein
MVDLQRERFVGQDSDDYVERRGEHRRRGDDEGFPMNSAATR